MEVEADKGENLEPAIYSIKRELERAKRIHPVWPTDPIHAAAIVSEEAGELVRAVNQFAFEGNPVSDVITEAVHVGAMAIRFLENIRNYQR